MSPPSPAVSCGNMGNRRVQSRRVQRACLGTQVTVRGDFLLSCSGVDGSSEPPPTTRQPRAISVGLNRSAVSWHADGQAFRIGIVCEEKAASSTQSSAEQCHGNVEGRQTPLRFAHTRFGKCLTSSPRKIRNAEERMDVVKDNVKP